MTEAQERRAVRFEVVGRVQGVFFRDFTRGTADDLGICGWVRNRSDGAVEGEAAGTPGQLRTFEEALRQGPPDARVDSYSSQPLEPEPSFPGFEIRF